MNSFDDFFDDDLDPNEASSRIAEIDNKNREARAFLLSNGVDDTYHDNVYDVNHGLAKSYTDISRKKIRNPLDGMNNQKHKGILKDLYMSPKSKEDFELANERISSLSLGEKKNDSLLNELSAIVYDDASTSKQNMADEGMDVMGRIGRTWTKFAVDENVNIGNEDINVVEDNISSDPFEVMSMTEEDISKLDRRTQDSLRSRKYSYEVFAHNSERAEYDSLYSPRVADENGKFPPRDPKEVAAYLKEASDMIKANNFSDDHSLSQIKFDPTSGVAFGSRGWALQSKKQAMTDVDAQVESGAISKEAGASLKKRFGTESEKWGRVMFNAARDAGWTDYESFETKKKTIARDSNPEWAASVLVGDGDRFLHKDHEVGMKIAGGDTREEALESLGQYTESYRLGLVKNLDDMNGLESTLSKAGAKIHSEMSLVGHGGATLVTGNTDYVKGSAERSEAAAQFMTQLGGSDLGAEGLAAIPSVFLTVGTGKFLGSGMRAMAKTGAFATEVGAKSAFSMAVRKGVYTSLRPVMTKVEKAAAEKAILQFGEMAVQNGLKRSAMSGLRRATLSGFEKTAGSQKWVTLIGGALGGGLQSGASTYAEARVAGKSNKEALELAGISTVITGGIMLMMGPTGIQRLYGTEGGKQVARQMLSKNVGIMKALAIKAGRGAKFVGRGIKEGVAEGSEEALDTIISSAWVQMKINPDMSSEDVWGAAVNSFLIGGMMGTLMSIPHNIKIGKSESNEFKRAYQERIDRGTVDVADFSQKANSLISGRDANVKKSVAAARAKLEDSSAEAIEQSRLAATKEVDESIAQQFKEASAGAAIESNRKLNFGEKILGIENDSDDVRRSRIESQTLGDLTEKYGKELQVMTDAIQAQTSQSGAEVDYSSLDFTQDEHNHLGVKVDTALELRSISDIKHQKAVKVQETTRAAERKQKTKDKLARKAEKKTERAAAKSERAKEKADKKGAKSGSVKPNLNIAPSDEGSGSSGVAPKSKSSPEQKAKRRSALHINEKSRSESMSKEDKNILFADGGNEPYANTRSVITHLRKIWNSVKPSFSGKIYDRVNGKDVGDAHKHITGKVLQDSLKTAKSALKRLKESGRLKEGQAEALERLISNTEQLLDDIYNHDGEMLRETVGVNQASQDAYDDTISKLKESLGDIVVETPVEPPVKAPEAPSEQSGENTTGIPALDKILKLIFEMPETTSQEQLDKIDSLAKSIKEWASKLDFKGGVQMEIEIDPKAYFAAPTNPSTRVFLVVSENMRTVQIRIRNEDGTGGINKISGVTFNNGQIKVIGEPVFLTAEDMTQRARDEAAQLKARKEKQQSKPATKPAVTSKLEPTTAPKVGETRTVFKPDGTPVKIKVTAVSKKSGAYRGDTESGENILASGIDYQSQNPSTEDRVIQSPNISKTEKFQHKKVSELSNDQLETASEELSKKSKTKPKSDADFDVIADLTAIKAEIARRGEDQSGGKPAPASEKTEKVNSLLLPTEFNTIDHTELSDQGLKDEIALAERDVIRKEGTMAGATAKLALESLKNEQQRRLASPKATTAPPVAEGDPAPQEPSKQTSETKPSEEVSESDLDNLSNGDVVYAPIYKGEGARSVAGHAKIIKKNTEKNDDGDTTYQVIINKREMRLSVKQIEKVISKADTPESASDNKSELEEELDDQILKARADVKLHKHDKHLPLALDKLNALLEKKRASSEKISLGSTKGLDLDEDVDDEDAFDTDNLYGNTLSEHESDDDLSQKEKFIKVVSGEASYLSDVDTSLFSEDKKTEFDSDLTLLKSKIDLLESGGSPDDAALARNIKTLLKRLRSAYYITKTNISDDVDDYFTKQHFDNYMEAIIEGGNIPSLIASTYVSPYTGSKSSIGTNFNATKALNFIRRYEADWMYGRADQTMEFDGKTYNFKDLSAPDLMELYHNVINGIKKKAGGDAAKAKELSSSKDVKALAGFMAYRYARADIAANAANLIKQDLEALDSHLSDPLRKGSERVKTARDLIDGLKNGGLQTKPTIKKLLSLIVGDQTMFDDIIIDKSGEVKMMAQPYYDENGFRRVNLVVSKEFFTKPSGRLKRNYKNVKTRERAEKAYAHMMLKSLEEEVHHAVVLKHVTDEQLLGMGRKIMTSPAALEMLSNSYYIRNANISDSPTLSKLFPEAKGGKNALRNRKDYKTKVKGDEASSDEDMVARSLAMELLNVVGQQARSGLAAGDVARVLIGESGSSAPVIANYFKSMRDQKLLSERLYKSFIQEENLNRLNKEANKGKEVDNDEEFDMDTFIQGVDMNGAARMFDSILEKQFGWIPVQADHLPYLVESGVDPHLITTFDHLEHNPFEVASDASLEAKFVEQKINDAKQKLKAPNDKIRKGEGDLKDSDNAGTTLDIKFEADEKGKPIIATGLFDASEMIALYGQFSQKAIRLFKSASGDEKLNENEAYKKLVADIAYRQFLMVNRFNTLFTLNNQGIYVLTQEGVDLMLQMESFTTSLSEMIDSSKEGSEKKQNKLSEANEQSIKDKASIKKALLQNFEAQFEWLPQSMDEGVQDAIKTLVAVNEYAYRALAPKGKYNTSLVSYNPVSNEFELSNDIKLPDESVDPNQRVKRKKGHDVKVLPSHQKVVAAIKVLNDQKFSERILKGMDVVSESLSRAGLGLDGALSELSDTLVPYDVRSRIGDLPKGQKDLKLGDDEFGNPVVDRTQQDYEFPDGGTREGESKKIYDKIKGRLELLKAEGLGSPVSMFKGKPLSEIVEFIDANGDLIALLPDEQSRPILRSVEDYKKLHQSAVAFAKTLMMIEPKGESHENLDKMVEVGVYPNFLPSELIAAGRGMTIAGVEAELVGQLVSKAYRKFVRPPEYSPEGSYADDLKMMSSMGLDVTSREIVTERLNAIFNDRLAEPIDWDAMKRDDNAVVEQDFVDQLIKGNYELATAYQVAMDLFVANQGVSTEVAYGMRKNDPLLPILGLVTDFDGKNDYSRRSSSTRLRRLINASPEGKHGDLSSRKIPVPFKPFEGGINATELSSDYIPALKEFLENMESHVLDFNGNLLSDSAKELYMDTSPLFLNKLELDLSIEGLEKRAEIYGNLPVVDEFGGVDLSSLVDDSLTGDQWQNALKRERAEYNRYVRDLGVFNHTIKKINGELSTSTAKIRLKESHFETGMTNKINNGSRDREVITGSSSSALTWVQDHWPKSYSHEPLKSRPRESGGVEFYMSDSSVSGDPIHASAPDTHQAPQDTPVGMRENMQEFSANKLSSENRLKADEFGVNKFDLTEEQSAEFVSAYIEGYLKQRQHAIYNLGMVEKLTMGGLADMEGKRVGDESIEDYSREYSSKRLTALHSVLGSLTLHEQAMSKSDALEQADAELVGSAFDLALNEGVVAFDPNPYVDDEAAFYTGLRPAITSPEKVQAHFDSVELALNEQIATEEAALNIKDNTELDDELESLFTLIEKDNSLGSDEDQDISGQLGALIDRIVATHPDKAGNLIFQAIRSLDAYSSFSESSINAIEAFLNTNDPDNYTIHKLKVNLNKVDGNLFEDNQLGPDWKSYALLLRAQKLNLDYRYKLENLDIMKSRLETLKDVPVGERSGFGGHMNSSELNSLLSYVSTLPIGKRNVFKLSTILTSEVDPEEKSVNSALAMIGNNLAREFDFKVHYFNSDSEDLPAELKYKNKTSLVLNTEGDIVAAVVDANPKLGQSGLDSGIQSLIHDLVKYKLDKGFRAGGEFLQGENKSFLSLVENLKRDLSNINSSDVRAKAVDRTVDAAMEAFSKLAKNPSFNEDTQGPTVNDVDSDFTLSEEIVNGKPVFTIKWNDARRIKSIKNDLGSTSFKKPRGKLLELKELLAFESREEARGPRKPKSKDNMGEIIPFDVDVENFSNSNLEELATLKQEGLLELLSNGASSTFDFGNPNDVNRLKHVVNLAYMARAAFNAEAEAKKSGFKPVTAMEVFVKLGQGNVKFLSRADGLKGVGADATIKNHLIKTSGDEESGSNRSMFTDMSNSEFLYNLLFDNETQLLIDRGIDFTVDGDYNLNEFINNNTALVENVIESLNHVKESSVSDFSEESRTNELFFDEDAGLNESTNLGQMLDSTSGKDRLTLGKPQGMSVPSGYDYYAALTGREGALLKKLVSVAVSSLNRGESSPVYNGSIDIYGEAKYNEQKFGLNSSRYNRTLRYNPEKQGMTVYYDNFFNGVNDDIIKFDRWKSGREGVYRHVVDVMGDTMKVNPRLFEKKSDRLKFIRGEGVLVSVSQASLGYDTNLKPRFGAITAKEEAEVKTELKRLMADHIPVKGSDERIDLYEDALRRKQRAVDGNQDLIDAHEQDIINSQDVLDSLEETIRVARLTYAQYKEQLNGGEADSEGIKRTLRSLNDLEFSFLNSTSAPHAVISKLEGKLKLEKQKHQKTAMEHSGAIDILEEQSSSLEGALGEVMQGGRANFYSSLEDDLTLVIYEDRVRLQIKKAKLNALAENTEEDHITKADLKGSSEFDALLRDNLLNMVSSGDMGGVVLETFSTFYDRLSPDAVNRQVRQSYILDPHSLINQGGAKNTFLSHDEKRAIYNQTSGNSKTFGRSNVAYYNNGSQVKSTTAVSGLTTDFGIQVTLSQLESSAKEQETYHKLLVDNHPAFKALKENSSLKANVHKVLASLTDYKHSINADPEIVDKIDLALSHLYYNKGLHDFMRMGMDLTADIFSDFFGSMVHSGVNPRWTGAKGLGLMSNIDSETYRLFAKSKAAGELGLAVFGVVDMGLGVNGGRNRAEFESRKTKEFFLEEVAKVGKNNANEAYTSSLFSVFEENMTIDNDPSGIEVTAREQIEFNIFNIKEGLRVNESLDGAKKKSHKESVKTSKVESQIIKAEAFLAANPSLDGADLSNELFKHMTDGLSQKQKDFLKTSMDHFAERRKDLSVLGEIGGMKKSNYNYLSRKVHNYMPITSFSIKALDNDKIGRKTAIKDGIEDNDDKPINKFADRVKTANARIKFNPKPDADDYVGADPLSERTLDFDALSALGKTSTRSLYFINTAVEYSLMERIFGLSSESDNSLKSIVTKGGNTNYTDKDFKALISISNFFRTRLNHKYENDVRVSYERNIATKVVKKVIGASMIKSLTGLDQLVKQSSSALAGTFGSNPAVFHKSVLNYGKFVGSMLASHIDDKTSWVGDKTNIHINPDGVINKELEELREFYDSVVKLEGIAAPHFLNRALNGMQELNEVVSKFSEDDIKGMMGNLQKVSQGTITVAVFLSSLPKVALDLFVTLPDMLALSSIYVTEVETRTGQSIHDVANNAHLYLKELTLARVNTEKVMAQSDTSNLGSWYQAKESDGIELLRMANVVWSRQLASMGNDFRSGASMLWHGDNWETKRKGVSMMSNFAFQQVAFQSSNIQALSFLASSASSLSVFLLTLVGLRDDEKEDEVNERLSQIDARRKELYGLVETGDETLEFAEELSRLDLEKTDLEEYQMVLATGDYNEELHYRQRMINRSLNEFGIPTNRETLSVGTYLAKIGFASAYDMTAGISPMMANSFANKPVKLLLDETQRAIASNNKWGYEMDDKDAYYGREDSRSFNPAGHQLHSDLFGILDKKNIGSRILGAVQGSVASQFSVPTALVHEADRYGASTQNQEVNYKNALALAGAFGGPRELTEGLNQELDVRSWGAGSDGYSKEQFSLMQRLWFGDTKNKSGHNVDFKAPAFIQAPEVRDQGNWESSDLDALTLPSEFSGEQVYGDGKNTEGYSVYNMDKINPHSHSDADSQHFYQGAFRETVIRGVGWDTPETSYSNKNQYDQAGRQDKVVRDLYGQDAKLSLGDKVFIGKEVRGYVDKLLNTYPSRVYQSKVKDRNGRKYSFTEVFIAGKSYDLGVLVVAKGLAFARGGNALVAPPNMTRRSYNSFLKKAERHAKSKKLGYHSLVKFGDFHGRRYK
jgi:hypothetical protein